MIREDILDDKQIEESLDKNVIERNQYLNTFMSLLNTVSKKSVFTVDGSWGSGKTVFVKQLEFICTKTKTKIPMIDDEVVGEFREKFNLYYFNAWENDFHDDPLQSMLFSLINDMWNNNERRGDKVVQITRGLSKSFTKAASMGIIDVSEIDKAKSISALAKNIHTANERKEAVEDILNNYLDKTKKKLIFVIDELDRCNPTYAVKVLETIKHYYLDDRVIFLLSTNNIQLSKTIKRIYGNDFDGDGYLNKFYDLVFNLPPYNRDQYIRSLGFSTSRLWNEISISDIATYSEMSLREINRYYSSMKLIEGYLDGSVSSASDHNIYYSIVRNIFVPFAYYLRVKSVEDYYDFTNGKGLELISKYINASEKQKNIINRTSGFTSGGSKLSSVIDIYVSMFRNNAMDNSDLESAKLYFEKSINLMSATGSIG